MDMEQLRKVLRLVCSKQPSFVLNILHTVGGDGPEQPRSERRTARSWCVCTYAGICRQTGREYAVTNPERIVNQGYQ